MHYEILLIIIKVIANAQTALEMAIMDDSLATAVMEWRMIAIKPCRHRQWAVVPMPIHAIILELAISTEMILTPMWMDAAIRSHNMIALRHSAVDRLQSKSLQLDSITAISIFHRNRWNVEIYVFTNIVLSCSNKANENSLCIVS